MSNEKRKYELKERAAKQQDTRRRIAAATADLHEEVGPARTTIAEVARRAGVQRPTVYNNFPTERELFAACQAHFIAANPLPSFDAAFALEDPAERLEEVLVALYGWFRKTRRMSGNVRRDRKLVPELDALMADTSDLVYEGLATQLAAGFGATGRQAVKVRAAVRLALDFTAWERLADEGLSDREAANFFRPSSSTRSSARR
jgi:AcrR family transcriptional regulator